MFIVAFLVIFYFQAFLFWAFKGYYLWIIFSRVLFGKSKLCERGRLTKRSVGFCAILVDFWPFWALQPLGKIWIMFGKSV